MLTLTRRAGLRGGALLQDLRSQVHAIDIHDATQAGICLEAEAPLATRNVSHFQGVRGLHVAHPTEWPTDR